MGKGADFERGICRTLSLWWSGGKRDDLFWRTAGSGARATTRRKKGVHTANSCGDVAALDYEGRDLVRLITFELKRGYPRTSFADHFENPNSAKLREWEDFIEQAVRSARNAGTPYWMLVTRRDRRQALCFFPFALLESLRLHGAFRERCHPFGILWLTLEMEGERFPVEMKVVVLRLEDFLRHVSPANLG